MTMMMPREDFAPAKARRLAALADCNVLDTPPEPSFDDIAQLAAEICGTEMAAIGFVAEHRQWFKAAINLPARETPISQSFCAHVVAQNRPMIVADATKSPVFSDNPLVTGQPGIRFYGGAPICAPDGSVVAALCVIDRAARPEGLTDLQCRALETLATQVERLLELRVVLAQRDEHIAAQRRLTADLGVALRHDFLTGLPNRSAFQIGLTMAIEEHNAVGGRTALLLLDLDHFKQINDWLGHDAGDEVLKDFSVKLRRSIRREDIVARLGGDEFGIILHGIDSDHQLAAAVHSITERLKEPLQYQGHTIAHRQSIGIALYPDHAADAKNLFRHCDLALAEAKSLRGDVAIFDPAMATEFCSYMELLEQAEIALSNGAISAYYQPKVDLRSGRIVGFEALARHDRPGMPPEHPAMFEALFRDAALSRMVTERIFEQVLKDIRRWDAEGLDYGHVALNASTHDFADDRFGEHLIQRLQSNKVDPSRVQVEVTETVLLGRGQAHVVRALELLHNAGIRIALDDFGTGHASLIHLKQFPVSSLKIDRSFVKTIDYDLDNDAIVGAIIGLGRSLSIESVAEGIETIEQLQKLTAKGCDMGQGYLFSKAVANVEVRRLIRETMPRAA